VEGLRSSLVVFDRGKDIAREHPHPNEPTIFRRSERTPALQESNRISVQLKLVMFFIPNDVSPRLLDSAQIAGHFLQSSLESGKALKRSLESSDNVNFGVEGMYQSGQAATDLRARSGRLGSPRTFPATPPVAGDTSACFLKVWRAISLFSRCERTDQAKGSRLLGCKVVSDEQHLRRTISRHWGLVLAALSLQWC